MALSVYNVRTRQKEPFIPLRPGQVGMYVCGLTVYDHMHIGHARTAVAFEVIRRWLERTHRVHYVQNVTDVDDKIIARAAQLGVSPREHAATWDAECARQSARLGVRPPDEAPHATTSMEGIVAFIEAILERGFAYATAAGNVYFDVPAYDAWAAASFPGCGYGSLSRRDYREMAAGTRKGVEQDKHHPADFALWKRAKDTEPQDARWPSPWGEGRPGWHIECSQMSTHALGDRFDVHAGGQDLVFPHHENEIAQSQAKTGQAPFVNYWLHTGFLNVEGQKMSKSLGNFITLAEMLDALQRRGQDPAVLRLYFVQTQYRSKVDFSQQGMDEAASALQRLERTRTMLAAAGAEPQPGDGELEAAAAALEDGVTAAMDDDFHTPGALAALFAFTRRANAAAARGIGAAAAGHARQVYERCGQVLTLFGTPPHAPPATPDFEALLQEREDARLGRDWERADSIRDQILAHGFRIEDTPGGPRVVPT